MITEIAILTVRLQDKPEFEASFAQAQHIISAMDGYLGHELLQCLEQENQYLLVVKWENLEAHTVGFRQSSEYQQWKQLLHHFYEPFPTVEHYQAIPHLSSSSMD
ncbi:MAG: antibiotic biosynthesis monooxygenase [Spirochaetota bacterium]